MQICTLIAVGIGVVVAVIYGITRLLSNAIDFVAGEDDDHPKADFKKAA